MQEPNCRYTKFIKFLFFLFFMQALLSGDKNSFHCNCSSLGKRVIYYNGGASSDVNRSKHSCPSLSIPESTLTWKHRQSPGGTQMIVFRASQFIQDSSSAVRSNKQKNGRKNRSQDIKGTSNIWYKL